MFLIKSTNKYICRIAHCSLEYFLNNWDHIRSPSEIAKNENYMKRIRDSLSFIQTSHNLVQGDSRDLSFIKDNSIHAVITSPPYWNLKHYSDNNYQLGSLSDLKEFIFELNKVWKQCFRVMVPGARLVCVVADICLSREENGRHASIPLHSYIQNDWCNLGLDCLSPIIWSKITNANYEWDGISPLYGSPYGPNGVIKSEIEYILIAKKPGPYRKIDKEIRLLSIISKEEYKKWFNQIWRDIPGTYNNDHPAPYPLKLADRLVRMFSYVGDTVLDPFCGSGTTNVACVYSGRNSIGVDIEEKFIELAKKRIDKAINIFQNSIVVPDLF